MPRVRMLIRCIPHGLLVCFRHFDTEKRDRELEIVQKLLSEDHRMKRQQERLSKPHWRPRDVVATADHGQRKVCMYVCEHALLSSAAGSHDMLYCDGVDSVG